jgi:hypothetical protein
MARTRIEINDRTFYTFCGEWIETNPDLVIWPVYIFQLFLGITYGYSVIEVLSSFTIFCIAFVFTFFTLLISVIITRLLFYKEQQEATKFVYDFIVEAIAKDIDKNDTD